MVRKRPNQELRDRLWGKPVPPHLKHGPRTMAYRFYGCDCWTCLPSGRRRPEVGTPHVVRQKNLREAKKGQPVPPGTKHGIYAYKVYACRCPVCQEAQSRKLHRKKNAWMYRTDLRGRWRQRMTPNGVVDVLCWPPAGAGPDWRCDCEDQRYA